MNELENHVKNCYLDGSNLKKIHNKEEVECKNEIYEDKSNNSKSHIFNTNIKNDNRANNSKPIFSVNRSSETNKQDSNLQRSKIKLI